jgi:hypothetical protein
VEAHSTHRTPCPRSLHGVAHKLFCSQNLARSVSQARNRSIQSLHGPTGCFGIVDEYGAGPGNARVPPEMLLAGRNHDDENMANTTC